MSIGIALNTDDPEIDLVITPHDFAILENAGVPLWIRFAKPLRFAAININGVIVPMDTGAFLRAVTPPEAQDERRHDMSEYPDIEAGEDALTKWAREKINAAAERAARRICDFSDGYVCGHPCVRAESISAVAAIIREELAK